MPKEVFILDSNIWISYVITRRLSTLVTLIHNHQVTILTSRPLVDEIHGVLSRPKFRKFIKPADIKEVISLHLKLCRFVVTDETLYPLTDVKDNFLLNLYNSGQDTVLVSGDKKLLLEASDLNYRVMTLREFELLFSY